MLSDMDTALCSAHDLTYGIDEQANVFRFEPRDAVVAFRLPRWLHDARICFRVDADGTHDVVATNADGHVTIQDALHVVGVYVVTRDPELRGRLDARCHDLHLLAAEASLGFDPTGSPDDLAALAALLTRGDD